MRGVSTRLGGSKRRMLSLAECTLPLTGWAPLMEVDKEVDGMMGVECPDGKGRGNLSVSAVESDGSVWREKKSSAIVIIIILRCERACRLTY